MAYEQRRCCCAGRQYALRVGVRVRGSVVMLERHTELLQKMPVFGGIRTDTLQFLRETVGVTHSDERYRVHGLYT